jgi:O-antigen ligase
VHTAGVWVAAIIGLGNIVVGLMTRSSASRVAVPIFAAVLVAGFVFRGRKSSGMIRPAVIIAFLGGCLGISFLLPTLGLLNSTDEEGKLIRNSRQSAYRLLLWKESLTLIADYPVFGRGGGASGGSFDNQLEYEGMEAHNTFLDLGIATGLTGLVIFLVGLTRILRQLWRARLIWEASFVSLVLIFSCFHNLLRQPLFWLLIAAGDYWRKQAGKETHRVFLGRPNGVERAAIKAAPAGSIGAQS